MSKYMEQSDCLSGSVEPRMQRYLETADALVALAFHFRDRGRYDVASIALDVAYDLRGYAARMTSCNESECMARGLPL